VNVPSRKLLGRNNGAAQRRKIYETPDGLETVSSDMYDVAQQRVLWEDVQFVTLHKEIGWSFVIVNGLPLLFFFGLMVMMLFAPNDGWQVGLVFFALGFPFLVAILTRVLLKVDVVTVHGRRSRTAMRWTFRKAKARAAYAMIVARAHDAQRRLAQQIRAEEAEYVEATTEMPELPPVMEAPEG
jgi:hypothetical protein